MPTYAKVGQMLYKQSSFTLNGFKHATVCAKVRVTGVEKSIRKSSFQNKLWCFALDFEICEFIKMKNDQITSLKSSSMSPF